MSRDASRGAGKPLYLSHEDGDERNTPGVFFDQDVMLNSRLDHDQLPRMYRAVAVCGHNKQAELVFRKQGVGVAEMMEGVGEEEERGRTELLSVEGRLRTFSGDWSGPPRRCMAEAGLYKLAQDGGAPRLACPFCPVKFRARVFGQEVDPWERHRSFSSKCPHVTLTSGTRNRRHSATSAQILGGR